MCGVGPSEKGITQEEESWVQTHAPSHPDAACPLCREMPTPSGRCLVIMSCPAPAEGREEEAGHQKVALHFKTGQPGGVTP